MKVVLFCGGQGMRLREYSEKIPKPMVPIGYRPIIWYVMKYYAHFGHKDFILCLGYQADAIKDYFVKYNEYVSNDFVFSSGGNVLNLLHKDIDDWTITFVDTGINSNIGQRLKGVEKYLDGEEMFLANYSDGLTDLPLPGMIESFKNSNATGMFMASRPSQSFHVVSYDENNDVKEISALSKAGVSINAGYFAFRHEIFDYIKPGEELVEQPFRRLMAMNKLKAYPYRGLFLTMDTFKEKQALDDMYARGETPWEVWRNTELQAAS
ncbi:MAG TPA: sugar phosphate nucleotidyltransferase [Chryseosolibacter sp.]|nr:sugar phosphate nucleotidyltransferase [Chryseosolibacter sp.]